MEVIAGAEDLAKGEVKDVFQIEPVSGARTEQIVGKSKIEGGENTQAIVSEWRELS